MWVSIFINNCLWFDENPRESSACEVVRYGNDTCSCGVGGCHGSEGARKVSPRELIMNCESDRDRSARLLVIIVVIRASRL